MYRSLYISSIQLDEFTKMKIHAHPPSLRMKTLPSLEKQPPSSPHGPLTSENGSEFQSVSKAEADQSETSSYVSFTSDNYDKAPIQQLSAVQRQGGPEQGAGAVLGVQERGAGGQESSTLYFSASEGATASHQGGEQATPLTWGKGSPVLRASPQPATRPFPITMANISPILGTGPGRRLRPSPAIPTVGASRGSAGSSWEQQELTRDLSHPATAGMWMSLPKVSPQPADGPCLTSTPKSESNHQDGSPPERLETETSVFI